MIKIRIVKYPDPFLNKKSEEVIDPSSKIITTLIRNLFEALDQQKQNGYGMTSTQIRSKKRVFVMKFDGRRSHFINPEIVRRKGLMRSSEGCYSFSRNLKYTINRSRSVVLQFQTHDGIKREEEFKGIKSVIVQHEVDHLDGITIYDRWKEQNGR